MRARFRDLCLMSLRACSLAFLIQVFRLRFATSGHIHRNMVAAFVKRPTSPVHFESAFTSSEDVLLAGSDEEETPEEHRNKRRRVESLAKQYLEGKGLFILTAGLRGPLNEGWVNPWASKSSSSKTKEIRRISEVAKRSVEDSTQRKGPDSRSSTVEEISTHLEFKYKGPGVVDAPHELQLEHNKNSDDAKDDPRLVSYLMQDIGAISHNQSDFRNWNSKELAQINNKSYNHPRGWLKSDNSLISKQPRHKSKSPTPSPAPRIRESHGAHITASSSTKSPSTISHSRVVPQERKDFVTRETSNFGFTPVNGRIVSTGLGDHFAEYKSSHLDLQNNHIEFQPKHPLKRSVLKANLYEADNLTHEGVNDVDQKSLDQSIKHDDHFKARKLSQDGALETNQNSLSTNARESTVYAHDNQVSQAHIEKKPVKNELRDHKASLQALPASTYLPEFEYRYANKPSTSPSKERLSFAEALEAAKKEAEIKATKRVSFMAASAVNGFGSRRSSPSKSESLQKSQSSVIRPSKSIQGGSLPKNDKIESLKDSFSNPPNENLPPESFAQPEAQVIPIEPAGLVPSGPSTNLLETDKLSSLDEGDSYAHFSTQAAVLKAQQSFQNEFVSAIKKSPRHPLEPPKDNQPASTPPTALRKRHAIGAKILTPAVDDEEPMSTQAMVDAISPFVFSTLKKKKRASFAPSPTTLQSPVSPTTEFPSHSPSMATSISPSPSPLPSNDIPPRLPISRTHSKPSSSGVSLPSFSIAPNGTLTEIFQQDGQRPQQSFDPESWNLDDAIQEASSFLGTWDVETEAKKMAEKG